MKIFFTMQLRSQEANAAKIESPVKRLSASGAIIMVLCVASQVCKAEQQQANAQQNVGASLGSRNVGIVDIKSLPDTIGIEHQDRINRFNRMAAMVGIQPPVVDDMQLGAGQVPGFNYPIPVVRVRFEERVFFDFNKETMLPEATKILDVMAENMKRDVPDAQLTILGHTDAIGSDTYNFDLSRRRALSVMQELYSRGVRLSQMSTVAVGKTQPVAPNRTDEGRARNRRVEFMISASEQANLTLVSKRRIIAEWLTVDQAEQPMEKVSVPLAVLAPVLSASPTQGPSLQLAQTGSVQAKQPMPEAEAAKVAPQPDIKLMPLKEFHQAQLNHEFEL